MRKEDIHIQPGMMLKQEVAEKMFDLISPMPEKITIVDIGTGFGQSATFFSQLKPEATIFTIDGFGLYGDGRIYPKWEHEKVLEINQKIEKLGNVIQILGDSKTIPWELPIDVLFIDGDHTYQGCMNDFFRFYQWVIKGGIIIFDDYNQENNPNNGVKNVVQRIIKYNDNVDELIYEGYYCAILKKLE